MKKSILSCGAMTLVCLSCNNPSVSTRGGEKMSVAVTDSLHPQPLQFNVVPAPEWSSLFIRDHGWFGADGIFSVSRSGVESPGEATKSETIFWFSDTMIGEVENDSLKPGYKMVNNSIALLAGGEPDSASIHFRWSGMTAGDPKSLFVPRTPASKPGEYYWLGDGFSDPDKNSDLYIFAYRIMDIPDVKVFGFREVGNTLLVLSNDPAGSFTEKKQLDIPFFAGRPVDSVGSFGAAVLVNTKAAGAARPDGFLYVYGVRGKNKEVFVARVKPSEVEIFDRWKFWNGGGWTNDASELKPIADRASNEFSVSSLPDGRFVMVFQKDGIGKQVALRVGSSPAGPFGEIQDVYDVSEDLKESKNFFPYNAKAHPVLSAPGELLISYNINSFNFHKEIRQFPHLYRPRFIRLKYTR